MANALYDLGRQAFLEGSIAYLTDTIKVALVKSSYTPSTSTHQFYSDLTPGTHVIGTPQTLASKTSTNGVADAADITFTAVTAGSTISYLAIYKDTGVAGTSSVLTEGISLSHSTMVRRRFLSCNNNYSDDLVSPPLVRYILPH
jgi:hypothetical protein